MMHRSLLVAGLSVCLLSPAMAQPAANPALEAKVQRIINNMAPMVTIQGQSVPGVTLASRMAALNVPGISVAVIHNGKIEWARGFGVTKTGGPAVTTETLFQAGSISKPVTALAVLHLVQSGRVNLETDVNQYLKSWKVPENEFTKDKKVTLRGLLTHTAGLTVHGFPGYASNEPVPTLVQVLDGTKPANTAPIRVDTVPGTKWRYSGGGYTIAQQLLIDVTGKSFPAYLQQAVLGPLGMSHSTYEQPLPTARRNDVATPYNNNGPIPGGAHTYPEMAAAGLWTTASDLARYAIGVQQALAGQSNRVISKTTATAMVKRGGLGDYGLGPHLGGGVAHPYFEHGGVDEGFIANVVAYNTGDGLAIMTNSMNGGQLAAELQRTIAREYGWPDFAPTERVIQKVDAGLFDSYAGYYREGRFQVLNLSRERDHLAATQNARALGDLYPESERKWFFTNNPAGLSFEMGSSGEPTAVVLSSNELRAPRISATEAQKIADELADKVKNEIQDPAAQPALLANIEDMRAGKPDYARMSPNLARVTKEQLSDLQTTFVELGAVKSVIFKDVGPAGADIYEIAFEKGAAEFRVIVGPNGTLETLGMRRLP